MSFELPTCSTMKYYNQRYIRLPDEPCDDTQQVKNSKFGFPKITRLKVIAAVFIVVFTVCSIAVSCVNSGSKVSVCDSPKDSPPKEVSHLKSTSEHMKFHHMKKRLPQCLIIGSRKSGTRALITYLNIHSDVVAKGREMHYFDDDSLDHLSNESLEWYRREMPFSYQHQLTIEKTPAYFTESDVPERVYRMNSSIRLLLVLREPIERTHSDYLQIVEGKIAKNKEYQTFDEHVFDKDGNINRSYKGISRSVYHKHLKRWLEFFSMDQIFVVDSAELITNPAYVMSQVEDFLGLAHEIKPSHFYFNKTRGFYCIVVDQHTKCLAESKGRQHPALEPLTEFKLKRFFRPHNEKLYKLLNRNFHWDDE